ncbi:MAG: hypothetical protein KDD04_05735, partial [Sinomicrobium sp.]|nr:hypothetical protein [Sinomicrobium sp.]
MTIIQKTGLGLFVIALLIFTFILGLGRYQLTESDLAVDNQYHREAILQSAESNGMLGKFYSSSFEFKAAFKEVLKAAQQQLDARVEEAGMPEGVNEWDYRLGDWTYKDYTLYTAKHAHTGVPAENPLLFFLLTFGVGILGGLIYIIPEFRRIPGIRNNHIYQDSMTRGLQLTTRSIFLGAAIVGIILYGFFYMNQQYFWPAVSVVLTLLIIGLVLFFERQSRFSPARSASPPITGWLGVLTGVYLIGFYILLYWAPEHITSWMIIVDPLSRALNGGEASQWFVYGVLYTVIVLVMGVRMLAKYRHNKYQVIRTFSVMFFQTAFAFLLPEILVRLNYPYYDFKNIWPLNYTFFFDWNISNLINSGGLGIFMLVWGILLIIAGVPVITYFYGKRWYCSWVCG